MFNKKIYLFLLYLCLATALACGTLFKKKKNEDATSSSDARFPAEWDLTSDWSDGAWKVEDL